MHIADATIKLTEVQLTRLQQIAVVDVNFRFRKIEV